MTAATRLPLPSQARSSQPRLAARRRKVPGHRRPSHRFLSHPTASAFYDRGSSSSDLLGSTVFYISCIDFGLLAHLNGLHFRMGLFVSCLKTKVLLHFFGFRAGFGQKERAVVFSPIPIASLLFSRAMNVHVWRGHYPTALTAFSFSLMISFASMISGKRGWRTLFVASRSNRHPRLASYPGIWTRGFARFFGSAVNIARYCAARAL